MKKITLKDRRTEKSGSFDQIDDAVLLLFFILWETFSFTRIGQKLLKSSVPKSSTRFSIVSKIREQDTNR